MTPCTFNLDSHDFPPPFLSTAAFLSPARPLRALWILMALGVESNASQHRLAKRLGLSPARVNEYLREMETRGFVARQGETNRTMRYALTPEGRRYRTQIYLEFCGEMVRLYGHTKLPFRSALEDLAAEGFERLVLFGAAETCEMVCAAARGVAILVAGVVDGDPGRVGSRVAGHVVQAPKAISEIAPDVVLITSFGAADEIYQSIRHLEKKGIAVRKL